MVKGKYSLKWNRFLKFRSSEEFQMRFAASLVSNQLAQSNFIAMLPYWLAYSAEIERQLAAR